MSRFRWRSVFELVAIAAWLFAPNKVRATTPYDEVDALRLNLFWRAEVSEGSQGCWVLRALPSAKDVVVGKDPALQRDLVKAVEDLRAQDAAQPSEWKLKRGDSADFGGALKSRMRTYLDFSLIAPQKGGVDSGVFVLKVGYHPSVAARKPIEIAIIVRGSRAIAREPVVTTIGDLARHQIGNLGEPSEEERRTKVFVGVSDAVSADAASWAASDDHTIAFRAAAFAFQSAKRNDLQSNQPRGPEALKAGVRFGAEKAVISEIDGYVKEQFGLPGDWNPVPSDDDAKSVQSEYGPAPWKIRIALQAVEEVKFQVRGTRVDGTVEPVESHPHWAKKIAELEGQVQEHQRKTFDQLRGRLITADEFPGLTEKISYEVERENKIVAASVDTGERSIIFTGYFQPRVTELEAGAGYSTDKQLNGSLSFTSQNLLVDESLFKLSAIAGLEKRTGELSYALPYFTSRDHSSSSSLDLNATYGKDDDLKLGAPKRGGFDEERFSASVRNTFQISKEHVGGRRPATATNSPEQPPGRVFSTVLAVSAGFSDTQLDAPPALRSEVEIWQVLFLLLDLQQSWKWKLRVRDESGLGLTSLAWNLKAKKGFKVGPGDFDFFAGNTTLTGDVYFGDKTSRDFLLRLVAGGALVSGNDPIFEEFRIGGDTIVRGLEEGERIARGAFFGTTQLGVALERLWRGGSEALGVDLKNVYLSHFFDHAFITRRGSRDPENTGSRYLKAIGASLAMAIPSETVQGSLEFGYAWSPDSIHEHGRVFTSVRLDF